MIQKKHTFTFDYNDIQSLIDGINGDTAAVILEPMTFAEPKEGFLQEIREICNKNGTVLIFDEMWTGWRLALGGAQEYFGVNADLICFSKAIANGMPLSVLCGKKSLMQLLEKDVFFFTTFGGEALSLAAAKATINEMKSKNVPVVMAEKGTLIKSGIQSLLEQYAITWLSCIGHPVRTMFTYTSENFSPLEIKTLIHQELLKHGILWNGFHTISFSHTESDVNSLLTAYSEIIPFIDSAIKENIVRELIQGELMQPVFRKTSNFNTKPVN